MDKPNLSHTLASFISKNVHRLNGKAKYFTVEGDFESVIFNKHTVIESKMNFSEPEIWLITDDFDFTTSYMLSVKEEMSGDVKQYREKQAEMYNRKEPEANP